MMQTPTTDKLAETVRLMWDRHAEAIDSGDERAIIVAHLDVLRSTKELEEECLSLCDQPGARRAYEEGIDILSAQIEDAERDLAKLAPSCPGCSKPAHASETDDENRHPNCR